MFNKDFMVLEKAFPVAVKTFIFPSTLNSEHDEKIALEMAEKELARFLNRTDFELEARDSGRVEQEGYVEVILHDFDFSPKGLEKYSNKPIEKKLLVESTLPDWHYAWYDIDGEVLYE